MVSINTTIIGTAPIPESCPNSFTGLKVEMLMADPRLKFSIEIDKKGDRLELWVQCAYWKQPYKKLGQWKRSDFMHHGDSNVAYYLRDHVDGLMKRLEYKLVLAVERNW